MELHSTFLEVELPSLMAQDIDTWRGGKPDPFMQFLAADKGLEGEGKEREDVMSCCFVLVVLLLAKNVWHMSAQLPPKLVPAPLSSTALLSWVQPRQELQLTQGSSQMQCLCSLATLLRRKELIPTPAQAPTRPS